MVAEKLAEILTRLQSYEDGWRQFVQKDRDGGDSLNRLGCVYSCLFALGHYDIVGAIDRLVINRSARGRFRRHPDGSRWYSNPNNVTRDQMLPVECMWALSTTIGQNMMNEHGYPHLWLRSQRYLTHFSDQNGGHDHGPIVHKRADLATPSEIAIISRCTGRLLWTNYFWDLFIVFDVLITRNLTRRNRYDMDNQLLPVVLAASLIRPTIWSRLAKWIYSKTDADKHILSYHDEGEFYENGILVDVKNGIKPLGDLMALTFRVVIKGEKIG